MGGLTCGDGVPLTNEHMPALQKNEPKKAAKILKEEGADVHLAIHNNIGVQSRNFIQELLGEYNNSSNATGKELLEKLAVAIGNSDGAVWGGDAGVFKLKTSVAEAVAQYEKEFKEKYGDHEDAEFSKNASLTEGWLLGNCTDCMEALKFLKASNKIAHTLYWTNGMDGDSITYDVIIILKDGTALSIYFGN